MSDILKVIQERYSARSPFDPKRNISRQDMDKILEAGRWTPTAHNMQNFEIVAVDDKQLLEAIGNIQAPISEVFLRENYQQMAFTEEEWKRKKTGVLATTFPPAWRKPDATPGDAGERPGFGKLIQDSPALMLVLYDPSRRAPASEGDFLGIISLGCLMENLWLQAQALGIGLQILSSLSNESMAREIKRLLGIPDNLMIAFSCRLGYPVAPVHPLRVRRDVEDFTHHNQYGKKWK